jgi:hypothetical protein
MTYFILYINFKNIEQNRPLVTNTYPRIRFPIKESTKWEMKTLVYSIPMKLKYLIENRDAMTESTIIAAILFFKSPIQIVRKQSLSMISSANAFLKGNEIRYSTPFGYDLGDIPTKNLSKSI